LVYQHSDAISKGEQAVQPNFDYMTKNSLLDYDVYMMGKPKIETAEMRAEQVYIKGRHGTLMHSDGTYDNISISFGIRFRSRGMAADAQKKRDIVKWLRYGYGYSKVNVDIPNTIVSLPIYQPEGHLQFHHMPNVTFKVKTIASFSWEWHPSTQQWFTQLNFLCDPFGYGSLKTYNIGTNTDNVVKSKTVYPKDSYCSSIGVMSYVPGNVGHQTATVGYESSQFRDSATTQEYSVLSSSDVSSYTSIGTVKEADITSNDRNLIRSCWTDPQAEGTTWGGYLGWGEYYNGEASWRRLVTYDTGGRPKYTRRTQNRFTIYNDHDSEDFLIFYKLWSPVDASITAIDSTYPNTDLRGKPLYCNFTLEGGSAQVAVRYRKAGTTMMTSLGWQTASHQVNLPSDAESVELCIKVPKKSSARIKDLGLFRNAKPSQHSINVSTIAVYETCWDIFAIAKSIDPNIFNGLTTEQQMKDKLSSRNLRVTLTYKLGFWSQDADKTSTFNSIRIGTRKFDNRSLYDKHLNLSSAGTLADFYQKIGTFTYEVPTPSLYVRADAPGASNRSGQLINVVIMDSVSKNTAWLQPSYTECKVTIDVPNTSKSISFYDVAEEAPVFPTILIDVDQTATKVRIDSYYNGGVYSVFNVDLQVAGALNKILIDTESMIVQSTSNAEPNKWTFYNGYSQGGFPYIASDFTNIQFYSGVVGATIYYRDKFLIS